MNIDSVSDSFDGSKQIADFFAERFTDMGLSELAKDDDIFIRLSKMSEPYGVKMKNCGKYIECSW